jgi:hypothetical protein
MTAKPPSAQFAFHIGRCSANSVDQERFSEPKKFLQNRRRSGYDAGVAPRSAIQRGE